MWVDDFSVGGIVRSLVPCSIGVGFVIEFLPSMILIRQNCCGG